MAKKLQKKHCWKKVRIQMADGVIEAKEQKLLATIGVLFMMAWPVAVFGLLVLVMTASNSFDVYALVMLGIVLAIPAVFAVALYRPPRVLRLYPEEQLAQRCRQLFACQLFSRWYDLNQAPIEIERSFMQVDKRELSAGQAALGCLMLFTGPFGFIISLFLNSNDRKRKRVYCLVYADAARHPIAVFLKSADVSRLVELYKAAEGTVDEPGSYYDPIA